MPVTTTKTVDWSGQNIPRLGHISFINSLPISHPIESGVVPLKANLICRTPAELNRGYESESIDLGAMSSYYYLSRTDLVLMDGLAISSNGPVGSVLFFSKVPCCNLNKAVISVPASSYTSVNLLKLLLLEEFGVSPQFTVERNPSLQSNEVDACLVIGDQALIADKTWKDFSYRYDLGSWWKQLTNLPMVFGLWAARKVWADANQPALNSITASLILAKEIGLSILLTQVIETAYAQTDISKERLRSYYTSDLIYDFTANHRQGLATYKELIEKHGLADPKSDAARTLSV